MNKSYKLQRNGPKVRLTHWSQILYTGKPPLTQSFGPEKNHVNNRLLRERGMASNMAIRVVEFSNGGYKIRKIFAKTSGQARQGARSLLSLFLMVDPVAEGFNDGSFYLHLFTINWLYFHLKHRSYISLALQMFRTSGTMHKKITKPT